MLFHKRTKKVIKYVWGFISILIVLSMVVTYSGFTMLAPTTATPPTTTPTTQEGDAVSAELQKAIEDANASNTMKLETSTPTVPPAAPVEQLDFSL